MGVGLGLWLGAWTASLGGCENAGRGGMLLRVAVEIEAVDGGSGFVFLRRVRRQRVENDLAGLGQGVLVQLGVSGGLLDFGLQDLALGPHGQQDLDFALLRQGLAVAI